jgi:hypothetical protein
MRQINDCSAIVKKLQSSTFIHMSLITPTVIDVMKHINHLTQLDQFYIGEKHYRIYEDS